MKWSIPAKTFLLGEYAALHGEPAIILTTTPCFELELAETNFTLFHPDSPAGRFCTHKSLKPTLRWHDPYQGWGGLGASSAQFVGVYLADCYLQDKTPSHAELLASYYDCAWNGVGMRPSGYDVHAQSLNGCVFMHRNADDYQIFAWPFEEIAFLLIHTQKKLATHQHLQTTQLPTSVEELARIVLQARQAFIQGNANDLVVAVNSYHQQLMHMSLVAEHSQQAIRNFQAQADVLAVKGCGALGADVLLLLTPTEQLQSLRHTLKSQGWRVLASSEDLYIKKALIENNPAKTLEISS